MGQTQDKKPARQRQRSTKTMDQQGDEQSQTAPTESAVEQAEDVMSQAGQRVGRMFGSLGQRVRQVADRTREEVTGDQAENKALARRFARELWVEANLNVADELCTSEFVRHGPEGEFQGPERMKQVVSQVRSAVSDLTSDFVDQIAEGNEVATRWVTRGTVQGKPVEIDGITINRIVNGKIAEDWSAYDAARLGMHA